MLSPTAKKLLAETIRGTAQRAEESLRGKLLRAIHDEAQKRYQLAVPVASAGLDEAHKQRRARLEAWVDERARASQSSAGTPRTPAKNAKELAAAKERLLLSAEKEAAATLINRLVLLRQLEAQGLSKPAVATGGWNSKGYREFREFAPALCANATTDGTEGFATLLQLVFDELAVDLPGLYGDVGLTRLFPIPPAMLREVIERLDAPALESAWTDDTTLGWVYQYWNDPDREALDAKIARGEKIEPHEIASKTQMFTERYMVEWLLQNSLGLQWLAMCKRRGWTAEAERVLPALDARRAEWREKREAGEVALDALMPIDGALEERWKYFVPQPIPDDAVARAPESVRALRVLDPACGSGHFLVIAFDLLAAMYREEAAHEGRSLSAREIAESILENNLHGIDIDPRAIQIAAAALYLKAKAFARDAHPKRLNLVAPVLALGNLPADDPAVVRLRDELLREVGIPRELTTRLLTALGGVDYLGSLLKVDAAVDEALTITKLEFEKAAQGDLFSGHKPQQAKLPLDKHARATVLDGLERFLAAHSKSEDLGLRLDGEQLAAGVRFVRIAKEGTYDLVVGNPPYQGLSKTHLFDYVAEKYKRGKADLYAAFLERGLEFARPGGISALLTMRGWMFLGQFTALRAWILAENDLRMIGDVDRGAFEDVPDEVLSTVMSVVRRVEASPVKSIALQPTATDDRSRDGGRTSRKRAALLAQVGRYEFDPRGFAVIEGEPIVYWWSEEFLARYAAAPKLGARHAVRVGLQTSDNTRFLRKVWEADRSKVFATRKTSLPGHMTWEPYVKGAAGRAWIEPLLDVILWPRHGLEAKVFNEFLYRSYTRTIKNEAFYFRRAATFTMIGAAFSARTHRFLSICDVMGSSVFTDDIADVLCLLNSTAAKQTLQSLNPTVHFQASDVARLPLLPIANSLEIYSIVLSAGDAHEQGRESSIEFRQPAKTCWRYAQAWAQLAVDRSEGAPLPPYEPVYDEPEPTAFVSFAVGKALGRFGDDALDAGILFLSTEGADSLELPPCAPLAAAWKEHGAAVGDGDDLRTYLRKAFFDYHKKLYENRPIYFPLSSAKKSFVALVSIHRWADDTLSVLLADHLMPTKRRLDGELEDVRAARAQAANKAKAERRFTDVQKLLEELNDLIAKVTELANAGAPPPDDKTPKREVDARFVMDLDDGVMVNSAALWPLLEPQWKDPKKWWKELATSAGKKDYDWSHLAARYFPKRVRQKCVADPSLGVAHKCFWELHPAKAYAWELRLQDEIRPDFTIDEPGSDAARAAFLKAQPELVKTLDAAEKKRRERKASKAGDDAQASLALGGDEDGEAGDAGDDDE